MRHSDLGHTLLEPIINLPHHIAGEKYRDAKQSYLAGDKSSAHDVARIVNIAAETYGQLVFQRPVQQWTRDEAYAIEYAAIRTLASDLDTDIEMAQKIMQSDVASATRLPSALYIMYRDKTESFITDDSVRNSMMLALRRRHRQGEPLRQGNPIADMLSMRTQSIQEQIEERYGIMAGQMGSLQPQPRKSGNACFVATVCYESAVAPEVNLLRDFRDDYLSANKVGRIMVHAYYIISPSITKYLLKHPVLTKVIRLTFMDPVVVILTRIYRDGSMRERPIRNRFQATRAPARWSRPNGVLLCGEKKP